MVQLNLGKTPKKHATVAQCLSVANRCAAVSAMRINGLEKKAVAEIEIATKYFTGQPITMGIHGIMVNPLQWAYVSLLLQQSTLLFLLSR